MLKKIETDLDYPVQCIALDIAHESMKLNILFGIACAII